MNKQPGDITELLKEHVQSLDPYAEITLLFPQGKGRDEELQVYVLSPNRVDFGLEQKYLNARYQVELHSGHSLSLYVYSKEDWHKQFSNTPIYHKVNTEGIVL
ncbi:hypothetical protein [Carboxylicivirga sp. N1Y90]|uniref:hypothetical protein n=1 Tax=Carboxylicivirga fragile TaxID=3417571 RepID=UPI003D3362D0|nr:hypothetical protein [Marinilabiliaceae bacterium N1Y90]